MGGCSFSPASPAPMSGAIFGLREMIEKLGVAQRAAETVSGSAG
jgi:hypothetical protein